MFNSLFNISKYTSRSRFSDYLPYKGYLKKFGLYSLYGPDKNITEYGFILKLAPLVFASSKTANDLENLFTYDFPAGTTIQTILHSSQNIEAQLQQYDKTHYVETPIFKKIKEYRINKIRSMNLRTTSVYIAVRIPTWSDEEVNEAKETIMQSLISASLNPSILKPSELINWLKELLNPSHSYNDKIVYDPDIPIKNQLIYSDTAIEENKDSLVIDGHHVTMLSPRAYPKIVYLPQLNEMVGDLIDRNKQIKGSFLIISNVMITNKEAHSTKLNFSASMAIKQSLKNIVRFVPKLGLKADNFKRLQYVLENNKKQLLKMYLQVISYADDPKSSSRFTESIKQVFKNSNFDLVKDVYINKISFLNSLPFRLKLNTAERLFKAKTCHSCNAANMQPIQKCWSGTQTPMLLLASRRKELVTFDLFDNYTGNKNCIIVATSGSGKSVLANDIITNSLMMGRIVFVIDIGRSYENICKTFGGHFQEFKSDSNIVFNPFSNIDNVNEEIETLKTLIAQMAFPKTQINDYQLAKLSDAILYTFEKYNKDSTITAVQDKLHGMARERDVNHMCFLMAEQLAPYARGEYKKIFNGKSAIGFKSNFTVLELEELNNKKQLQEVILLMQMFRFSDEVYLGRNDNVKKEMISDEGWDLLRGVNTGPFIEKNARRIRKYGGSQIFITQGLNDLFAYSAGVAAWENSDIIIYLRQKEQSIKMLKKQDKIPANDFLVQYLSSITTIEGAFSEMYIDTPIGSGLAQLHCDRYSLKSYSTSPEDRAQIKKYIEAGYGREEAILKAIERPEGRNQMVLS